MEINIQCKIDSCIQLQKSYVERISPSVSGFGLSVVTDAAASVKILSKFGDLKKKEEATHVNRCLYMSIVVCERHVN